MKSPYLAGRYAPIHEEVTVEKLEVIGEIPKDLYGSYFRNGPNPHYEPRGRYHWFDGDGMLHAVHIEDGEVSYKNRWVRTAGFQAEEEAGAALWSGLMESTKENPRSAPYKDTSNTDVVFHAGSLYSLWYICGAAHELDPRSLQTRGPATFGGERPLKLSAHAKVDEVGKELLFFDYGFRPPFMRYGVIGESGVIDHLTDIELPGPRLPHDMAFTERYSILMDLPIHYRPEALKMKRWVTGFYPDHPARFGVIPRRGQGSEIRWFEAEPCYIYHVVNAWEEGEEIVMVGCRVSDPIPATRPEDGPYARALANLRVVAHLHRWRFNLATGETKEETLDDLNSEFPTINGRYGGRPSRYGYNVSLNVEDTMFFDGLVKYDTDTGARERFAFGEGRWGSEAPFAPRVGATAEDDGYLLSFVHDSNADRSELWVLRGQALSEGPIAKVPLPQRVPPGFHATWVPGELLEEGSEA